MDIFLICIFWIMIGLFIDHQRDGYSVEVKRELGLVDYAPARTIAFILAPFNLCLIVFKLVRNKIYNLLG